MLLPLCAALLAFCTGVCAQDVGTSRTTTGKQPFGDAPLREEVWRTLIINRKYDMSDPPQWGKGTTKVVLSFELLRLVNFELQQGNFEAQFYIRAQWRDPRLAWTDEDLVQTPSVTFSIVDEAMDIIWRPDLTVKNVLTVHQGNMLGLMTQLLPDGNIYWSRSVNMKLAATFNFGMFPYDHQMLPIIFESYKYTTSIQNITWHSDNAAFVNRRGVNHSMYVVLGVYHKTSLTSFPELGYSTKALTVLIVMQRDSFALLAKTVMPSYVMVLLGTLGFWIDPFKAAPARIALLITCLLTQFALSDAASKYIPFVSYLTWMDIYLLCSMVATAFGLFEYGMVWHFAAKEDGKVRAHDLDSLCRTVVPVVFTFFALIMVIVGASTEPEAPSNFFY